MIDLSGAVNGRAPVIRLSSGYDMPVLGIGTYSLRGKTCVNAVRTALESGYRLIDTATFYGNEREVGEAVRDSGIPRGEIFVTTKLYPSEFDHAERALDEALSRLDIGYADLVLLHHPGRGDAEAYAAIERAIRAGRVRSAGVSCYYIREIDGFLPRVETPPALVQNEIHPYYQDAAPTEHIQSLGIPVQAWYPLGGRGWAHRLLADPTLLEIAAAHGKSAAQVVLRWELQRGILTIPGSSDPAHIRENISVFDFALAEDEMRRIAALERAEKHDWY